MKPLFWKIGTVAASATLVCCLFGCSSQPAEHQGEEQNEAATEETEVAAEEQQDESVSLAGAFRPLTGMNEPLEYNGTAAEIEQARENLKSNVASDDEKMVFVAIQVAADDRENRTLGVVNGNMRGATVSAAELTVDDINTYGDIYGLNSRDYFETLEQLGYHDGADNGELLGGSGDTYGAIFLFSVSNNDLEQGTTAHLEWGDYSIDFNMSDIQEVDSPLAMIDALQAA